MARPQVITGPVKERVARFFARKATWLMVTVVNADRPTLLCSDP